MVCVRVAVVLFYVCVYFSLLYLDCVVVSAGTLILCFVGVMVRVGGFSIM